MVADIRGVKTVEYKGNVHNKEHDPKISKVTKVLRDLRICQNQRKRIIKRGKRKITYDIYKSKQPEEWTIIGISSVRKRPPRFTGFIVVITCNEHCVKTFYFFRNKAPAFFRGRIEKYRSYQLLAPEEYPVLDISKIKVRRSV